MNLIEVTVSTILVGLVLVASVQATTGLVAGQAEFQARRQAEQFAEDLLDEIASVPYELTSDDRNAAQLNAINNSPPLVRANCFELSDYNGLFLSPPQLLGGTTPSQLTGWTASVTVTPVDPTDPSITIAAPTGTVPTDLSRVRVTMTPAGGDTIQRTRLISRFLRGLDLTDPVVSLGRVRIQRDSGIQDTLVPLHQLPNE